MTNTTEDTMQNWLKFENDTDEEPSHGANVITEDGETRIEWWHEAVGLVSTVNASSVRNAERWLTDRGFSNFTA